MLSFMKNRQPRLIFSFIFQLKTPHEVKEIERICVFMDLFANIFHFGACKYNYFYVVIQIDFIKTGRIKKTNKFHAFFSMFIWLKHFWFKKDFCFLFVVGFLFDCSHWKRWVLRWFYVLGGKKVLYFCFLIRITSIQWLFILAIVLSFSYSAASVSFQRGKIIMKKKINWKKLQRKYK